MEPQMNADERRCGFAVIPGLTRNPEKQDRWNRRWTPMDADAASPSFRA